MDRVDEILYLYEDVEGFADGGRIPFAKGTQPRTTAGTFDKVYSMAEIRELGKKLNVSEVIDGVKLDPDKFRLNVTKAKARTDFNKNQFDSLSPKKQKEFKKNFMKQIAKHQDGGFYVSAANRVPNATLVKRYFPNIDSKTANKIVTSINGILLNEFKNKGNVIKTSPKANANAIRMEDLRKITDPSFETAAGVQGTKGASLQHVASKNRMVTLNNLAYLEKKLNSSMSQNDKRIKIIENEVDRLIKTKPKNYVQRVNALNNEGMALASGYIKKDGKIVKGPTAGYSEFRVKDPLNEKLSYFGKDDTKTILPDRDSVLIQEDADLIDKPVKNYTPNERKRAIEISKKKMLKFFNDAGIPCIKGEGGQCTSIADYQKGYNKLVKEAADGKGSAKAINKLGKFTKGMRALKGAAKWTGYGVLAEIGFMVPFAAMDYAAGESWKRILGNATDYGFGPILGQSEQEEFEAALPKGSASVQAEEVLRIGNQLTDLEQRQANPGAGRPGLKKRVERGKQKVYDDTFAEYVRNMQPFLRPSPHLEGGRFYDQELFNKAMTEGTEAREAIADREAKTKERRSAMNEFDEEIFQYKGYAGGGIAGIRRRGAIPPESGPQPQGLENLKYYVTNT